MKDADDFNSKSIFFGGNFIMEIFGTVCEFNPFHNGHRYLFDRMRENDGYILCIMSGNFVQRGSFAVCDKYIRASQAVKNGADIVIELPLPYALGTAGTFARGGVGMLNKLGFIDRLYFGSESGEKELFGALEKTKTEAFSASMDSLMKSGLSYPDAFSLSMGESSLCGGNDRLALEYLKQLESCGGKIKPTVVKRAGNAHNSEAPCGEYASASYIRKLIYSGENINSYTPFCPDEKDISSQSKLDFAVLARLRQMSESDFLDIADVSEGLEYRLKKAAAEAKSPDDFIEKVKTKRYTLSKLRRIMLCSYLGVTKEMQSRLPDFVTVLAANSRGEKIISMMKKESDVFPVIRYSDTKNLTKADGELYDFTSKCDDLFGLTLPQVRRAGYDMTHKFVKEPEA